MQVIRKSIKCSSREEYYKLHLNIINPLLPNKLTEKEITILASFMSIDEKLVEDDRFNSLVRKKIMEKHKLSAGGLSNYLKAMINKGFLTRSEVTGRIKISKFMIPEGNLQGYQFRIGYQIVKENLEKAVKNTLKSEPDLGNVTKEKESPLDGEITENQREINKRLAMEAEESHNAFNESRPIIEEEEEDSVPYKMKD